MQNLSQLITLPTKQIKLPKTQKIINIRSFTSKEQKNMKLGLQSNSANTVSSTMRRVFESCIEEDIDIKKLPLIDLEYLFLQLTIMSSGSYVNVGYKCLAEVDGEKCGEEFDVQYDLEEVDFDFSDGEDTKIFKINEKVSVEIGKPKSEQVFEFFGEAVKSNLESADDIEQQVIKNIINIYIDDTVVKASDYSYDDLLAFVECFPFTLMKDIRDFLSEVDQIVLRKKFKCPKCSTVHSVEKRGLESFLA